MIPYALTRSMIVYWLSKRKAVPLATIVSKTLPAFHLTLAVISTLYRPFGRPFQVTAKGLSHAKAVIQWPIFSIFLVLILLLLSTMLMNLVGFRETVMMTELTPLDVGWSLYSLFVLTLSAVACVELPRATGTVEAREVRHGNLLQTLRAMLIRLFA